MQPTSKHCMQYADLPCLHIQGNLSEQEGFDLVQLCGTFSANPFIMAFAQVSPTQQGVWPLFNS